ncbi:MAG: hypothetical protein JSS83_23275 [Cyanobacteria bacterium SZAS LIN-3]|nr:hypothetical protein [Cyanobacteria bacterium SZAS LIN-3]
MVKKYSKADYPDRELKACHQVLMEIVGLLHEYSDHIALVGGWVPFFAVPQGQAPHLGSTDVDIAFDFQNISDDTYSTILKILSTNGYYQTESGKHFQWWKDIKIDGGDPVIVGVDLLAPEYGGTGKKRESQAVQDAKALKARGSDLIFDESHRYMNIEMEGALPGGALDSVKCRVAGVVPFLVMKGMALRRNKPKDSYDIEYIILNYPGGLTALVDLFKRDANLELVREGLGKIRRAFESADHTGPNDIAMFLEITGDTNLQIRKREAFERVSRFLDALGIEKYV